MVCWANQGQPCVWNVKCGLRGRTEKNNWSGRNILQSRNIKTHFNIHSFLPSFLFLLPWFPVISSFLVCLFFSFLLCHLISPGLSCLLSIFIPFSSQFPLLISFLLSLSFFASIWQNDLFRWQNRTARQKYGLTLANQLAGQEELPCTRNIDRPLAKTTCKYYNIALLGKNITQLLTKQFTDQTDLPCPEISPFVLSKPTCYPSPIPFFAFLSYSFS